MGDKIKSPAPYHVCAAFSSSVPKSELPLIGAIDDLVKMMIVTERLESGTVLETREDVLKFVQEHIEAAWEYYDGLSEKEFSTMLFIEKLAHITAAEIIAEPHEKGE